MGVVRDDEFWMRKAIEVAMASEGAKVGSIIVCDGAWLAHGQSLVRPKCDPSAHAEMTAIRSAAKLLSHHHLTNCTLYTTLEPCGMCLSACAWAGVERVVFGADWSITQDKYYEQKGYSSIDRVRTLHRDSDMGPIEITGGVLAGECARLLPARTTPAPARILLSL